jgi:hypothetical protein
MGCQSSSCAGHEEEVVAAVSRREDATAGRKDARDSADVSRKDLSKGGGGGVVVLLLCEQ